MANLPATIGATANRQNTGSLMQPLALRINDTCSAIGIGRTNLYAMIAAGKIKAIKIAGRTLIPRSEIDRLIADAPTAQ